MNRCFWVHEGSLKLSDFIGFKYETQNLKNSEFDNFLVDEIYSIIVGKLFFRGKLAVKHVLTDFFELIKAPWNRQIQPDSKLKFIIQKFRVLHDFLTQYDQFDLGWHHSCWSKYSQIRNFSISEFHIRIRRNQTISGSSHGLKNIGSNLFYSRFTTEKQHFKVKNAYKS